MASLYRKLVKLIRGDSSGLLHQPADYTGRAKCAGCPYRGRRCPSTQCFFAPALWPMPDMQQGEPDVPAQSDAAARNSEAPDMTGFQAKRSHKTLGLTQRDREKLVKTVMAQGYKADIRGRSVGRSGTPNHHEMVDLLFAGPGEPRLPDEVFQRVRWGGLFVCVGSHEKRIRRLAEDFDGRRGFVIDQPVTPLWGGPLGLRIPGLTQRGWYFAARKVELIQPGDVTDRFTYHVRLARADDQPHGYVVVKEVPEREELEQRLFKKFPDVDRDDLVRRAHKLIDHVFPTFLTREAAILKVLERDLPEGYRSRVPKVLAVDKDEHGFVRRLTMNWLRVGGEPISQLEFARQSAELLCALHDHAGVIHLDLRLDNFVITENGVGFVDFGSSVRMGEQLEQSPMLSTLFEEMMRTSQIQRMLGRMIERGHVTSHSITQVHGKVDKTVDSFYLAVQINKPHSNPDLRELIRFDPESDEAKQLAALTAAILRPKNPDKAHFKTAGDILRGLRRIESKLGMPTRRAA